MAFALLALALAAPMPAFPATQVAPGQFDPQPEFAVLTMRSKKIAHCVLNRARKASRNMVLAINDPRVEGDGLGSIDQALGGCMSANDASITVQVFDLRGDLAEQLLTENGGAQLARVSGFAPRAPLRLVAQGTQWQTNEAIVGCGVAADPSDGAALIVAQAATPPEMAAFRKLLPGLQACVPKGYELHLKPFEVRRLVAISLYRLADGAAANAEKN